MKKSTFKRVILVVTLISIISFAAGCSSMQPYQYKDPNEEMPGPGLISGETGEKTIFRLPGTSGDTQKKSE